MPTFRLHHEEVDALLRGDFSHPITPPWVVSIQRRQKARVPLYGLIDEHLVLEPGEVSGFDPAWVYPCYSSDAARFTCALSEEWKLSALLWMLTHPASPEDTRSWTLSRMRPQTLP